MNTKILIGVLTASMFSMSCGSSNVVQENTAVKKTTNVVKQNVVKPSVIAPSPENEIKNGNNVILRVTFPDFNTKAAESGQSSQNIAYLWVNLCHNSSDPLSDGSLFSNTWFRVEKSSFNSDIVIANVTGGSSPPGATWYGALRAYDAGDNEIAEINSSLTGSSSSTRIVISDNAVYVGYSNYSFYTDNSFTTLDNKSAVINFTLTIENIGATITSGLNVNNGSGKIPGIKVKGK